MHITDTHLDSDNIDASLWLIAKACDKEKPDLVVVTGDNVLNCDDANETKMYIDKLMNEISEYRYALVYQTVTELEDSFDFEGMVEAKKKSYPLAQSLRGLFDDSRIKKTLHLGAGGCGVCRTCAKQTGEPCRFPEKAMPSLEAYGINVSELAKASGMKYINGQNTVTYFGAVLFDIDEE